MRLDMLDVACLCMARGWSGVGRLCDKTSDSQASRSI